MNSKTNDQNILQSQKAVKTSLERFECRKTKTEVIILVNHEGHRQFSEPINTQRNLV